MKIIGLKKGTVKLVPYKQQWERFFEMEKTRIKKAFQNWILGYNVEIEHIGSTSIPDISAKPIIDILIGVRSSNDEDINWTKEILEKLGYEFMPLACEEDKLFFALGDDSNRTHHVHVVLYGSTYWNNDLMFRDYLRAHSGIAIEYDQLKKELSKKYQNDRKSYTQGKEKFIQSVLEKACKKIK